MRRVLSSLVFALAATAAVSLSSTSDASPPFRVFPADLGSVSGIAFDGEALWITRDGAPLLFRVDPRSGRVLRSFAFVTGDTGGSAWDGRTLWQIAYIEKMVYAIDPRTGRATPAFPTPGKGMCAGMTYDGRHLWIANFEDGRIYQVDTSGRVLGSIVGSQETTGLAWDGRYLWTGVLAGTKSHDETTPYSGFVQQLEIPRREPRRVWAVPGVGPGASDWLPGRERAERFWWYDGFNKRIVEIDVARGFAPAGMLAWAAALLALIAAVTPVRQPRDRSEQTLAAGGLGERAPV